jgi:citrate lyase beta subunit
MKKKTSSRRAILYTPASDWHKLERLSSFNVDSICVDLEDGVAFNRKDEARKNAVKALESLDFGESERLVRINSVESGLALEDLSAIIPAQPDGLVIPKIESAEQVEWVSNSLKEQESRSGNQPGSTELLLLVETALGIINLREIASSDARLSALIFGAEDFRSDIGAHRNHSGWEIFYARSLIVTFSAAFNLQAIDMVFVDLSDFENLRKESRVGADLGYVGKQIIHPNQIQIVQEAFTPSNEEIEYSRKIVNAYIEHQKKGSGAFVVNGKMVDLPTLRAAQRVLSRTRTLNPIDQK